MWNAFTYNIRWFNDVQSYTGYNVQVYLSLLSRIKKRTPGFNFTSKG